MVLMSEVKYEGREKREKLYLKVDFAMKTRNVERILPVRTQKG